MTDLVQRLRKYIDVLALWPDTADIFREAADEIERLNASMRRFQTLHEGLMQDAEKRYDAAYAETCTLAAERRRLNAENENLRVILFGLQRNMPPELRRNRNE